MNARLEIINTMTEPAAWLERVQEQMGLGKEILLLLSQLDDPKSKALSKLCHAYHYSQDTDMDLTLSDQCRKMLDMHDYAAKEHGFHPLLDTGVDDFWTDRDVAPFSGFGNGKPHAADAGFVHQIDNEFQFVQAFEVGHLRLITRFDQSLVAGQSQRRESAAKDGL